MDSEDKTEDTGKVADAEVHPSARHEPSMAGYAERGDVIVYEDDGEYW